MPNARSSAGRSLDDLPPLGGGEDAWIRPIGKGAPTIPGAPPRFASPQPRASADPLPLRTAQHACYEALGLALTEGQVFAAVTGPEGSGKTLVLDAVLTDRRDRSLRCIKIADPDKVPARLATQIEQVAYSEASKPENVSRHVVIAVDDAHTASDELLHCLTRLAMMREPGRRVPQVLLVGRPELWTRLSSEAFEPLARRLAIRAVLPAADKEQDPWASLEQDVIETAIHARAEGMPLPAAPAAPEIPHPFARRFEHAQPEASEPGRQPNGGTKASPPGMYALFPDPPPRSGKPARQESKNRMLLPLGFLAATVAAFGLVLSFYDWPDLFDNMPWAESKPAQPVSIPQTRAQGLPQLPSWAQLSPRTAVDSASAPPAAHAPGRVEATSAPPPAPALEIPKPVASSAQPLSDDAAPAQPAATAQHTPVPSPANTTAPSQSPNPPEPPATASASGPRLAQPPENVERPSEPAVASTPPEIAKPPIEVAAPAETPAHVDTASQTRAPAPEPPTPSLVASASQPVAVPTLPPSPSGVTQAAATAAPLSPSIVALLLRRGDEQSAIGDISAARLLFERAAEAGSAEGARRLAETFDKEKLPAADAATLADDQAARLWYGRAAALGSKEAAARLKSINQGR